MSTREATPIYHSFTNNHARFTFGERKICSAISRSQNCNDCSSIDHVLSVLNSFMKNIKLTFEEEKDKSTVFFDVLILTNDSYIETKVYRKLTHHDVYLHWNSLSPNSRKEEP